METLLQMAKRLGIRPNPDMTRAEFIKIRDKIRAVFKGKGSCDLAGPLYDKRKKIPQNWNYKVVERNIRYLKKMSSSGIQVFGQEAPLSKNLDDDAIFVWHSARPKGKNYMERFVASVRLDDPNLPPLYQKLDEFIKKYQAGFKITDVGHAERTDTLNVYMTQSITPEIAKEFYGIVAPFLKKENHEFLDGFSVKNRGREIEGIKYGPEPTVWGNLYKIYGSVFAKKIHKNVDARLSELPTVFRTHFDFYDIKNAGSLGAVSANVQYLDLLYYLAGKEGQNPFQLGNQFALPLNAGFPEKIARRYADKRIDISAAVTPVKTPLSRTTGPLVRKTAALKPTPVVEQRPLMKVTKPLPSRPTRAFISMQDLMRELSEIRLEIQSTRHEVAQIRKENARWRARNQASHS